jgi:DNA-binding beta-propeller fold protein YncE
LHATVSSPPTGPPRGWRIATPIVTELVLVLVLAGVVRVQGADHPIVIHTVSVGRGATAVAVAARTDRIFVTNSEDTSVSVLNAQSGTTPYR